MEKIKLEYHFRCIFFVIAMNDDCYEHAVTKWKHYLIESPTFQLEVVPNTFAEPLKSRHQTLFSIVEGIYTLTQKDPRKKVMDFIDSCIKVSYRRVYRYITSLSNPHIDTISKLTKFLDEHVGDEDSIIDFRYSPGVLRYSLTCVFYFYTMHYVKSILSQMNLKKAKEIVNAPTSQLETLSDLAEEIMSYYYEDFESEYEYNYLSFKEAIEKEFPNQDEIIGAFLLSLDLQKDYMHEFLLSEEMYVEKIYQYAVGLNNPDFAPSRKYQGMFLSSRQSQIEIHTVLLKELITKEELHDLILNTLFSFFYAKQDVSKMITENTFTVKKSEIKDVFISNLIVYAFSRSLKERTQTIQEKEIVKEVVVEKIIKDEVLIDQLQKLKEENVNLKRKISAQSEKIDNLSYRLEESFSRPTNIQNETVEIEIAPIEEIVSEQIEDSLSFNEMIEWLTPYKICIVGGHDNFHQSIDKVLDDVTFIKPRKLNYSANLFDSHDLIVYVSAYNNHGQHYKVLSHLKATNQKDKLLMINSQYNIEILLSKIYSFLLNKNKKRNDVFYVNSGE